jgi:hypothetical protein
MAENGDFEEIALEQWFQSHDHYESKVNRVPGLLGQYSNDLERR